MASLHKPDRQRRASRPRLKRFADWLVYVAATGLLRLIEALGPDRASNLGGRIARWIGPKLPVSNIARVNLEMVFPEKTEEEREAILKGVWDNLGRTACEYPHLDKLYDFEIEYYEPRRVEVSGIRNFQEMLWDGKPALIFTAHLANWELPAVSAARHGWTPPSCSARPTTPSSPTTSPTCAPEPWAGCCHARAGRSCMWQPRSSAATTSACWSIRNTPPG